MDKIVSIGICQGLRGAGFCEKFNPCCSLAYLCLTFVENNLINKMNEQLTTLFDMLKWVHYPSRRMKKMLKTCSVEELEAIAIDMQKTYGHFIDPLKNVMSVRKRKLNRAFVYTAENKARLLRVNARLMDAFEKADIEKQRVVNNLQQRLDGNDEFLHDFEVEVKITPYFNENCFDINNDDNYGFTILSVLNAILPDYILGYYQDDDVTDVTDDTDDTDVTDDYPNVPIYFIKELNWNECCGLSHGELAEEYISYGIHELYDSTEWSLQDILNIDNFWVEVKVWHQHFEKNV
jgi:hypothetical protein